MPRGRFGPFVGVLLFLSAEALASTLGGARGIVHDPGHRPIEGAQVTIRAQGSDWSAKTESDANGEFHFAAVPVGSYEVTVEATNFASSKQEISVTTEENPVFHFQLELGAMKQEMESRIFFCGDADFLFGGRKVRGLDRNLITGNQR